MMLVNPSDGEFNSRAQREAGRQAGRQLAGGCMDKKDRLSPQCKREFLEEG